MAPIQSNKGKGKATKKGPATKAKAKTKAGEGGNKNSSIEGVEQRILTKMTERAAFGVKDFSLDEMVKFAGYSWPTASKFIKAKHALLAKGLVEHLRSSKTFCLTDAGLKAAPNGGAILQTPKTNATFYDQLKEQFEKPKSHELLLLLADGRVHDRQETCTALGYKYTTAQAFAQSVSELKTLGFLELAGRGTFKLTVKAFPCGLPE